MIGFYLKYTFQHPRHNTMLFIDLPDEIVKEILSLLSYNTQSLVCNIRFLHQIYKPVKPLKTYIPDVISTATLTMMKWIHHEATQHNRTPWNHRQITFYVSSIECLKYIHQNGCSLKKYTCVRAAMNGNLECLKYLHENGCPWDTETTTYAAMNGHVDCLQYARDHGCPEYNR